MTVSTEHSCTSSMSRCLAVLLLVALTLPLNAVVEVTPEDNALVYSAQVAAHSSFAASVVGSLVAPPPLDLSFDATALASEQLLGFYPPTFDPPDSFSEFPNEPRTGSNDSATQRCVYRFRKTTDSNSEAHTSEGLRDTFASVWSIPVRFGTEGFADLKKPLVYHPYGEVKVSANNPFLTPDGYPNLSTAELATVRRRPEFPEGTHVIDWSGEKMVNPVIDIGLPGALFATFTLAEFRIGQKAGKRVIQRNYKGFRKSLVDIATKLELAGTTGYDLATAIGVDEFFEETSFVSGRNSGSQVLTVWDTHAPYFVNNNGTRIETQVVTVEAQDFGGIRFDRARAVLESQVSAGLRQIVQVVDTQPPLLVPPESFAMEAGNPITPASGFDFLGPPLVVDRADPDPFVENDAPTEFDPGPEGRRYDVKWWAFDDSGNDTRNDPRGLAPYRQTVTVKPPNSNNAPRALEPALTSGITSQPVEFELRGSDPDIIDGRPDPLAFEIDRYPSHGEFEAPLLPYFIDDYRLTPLGERREADTVSRVSPLGEFAEGFIAERTERGRQNYLNANFCNDAANPREIPLDFVYQPRQVRVDDDGNTTILDWFWMCDSSRRVHSSYISGVSLLYQRLSKWTDDGELIAMLPLEAHTNPALEPSPWSDRPAAFVREFSADHNQRVWLLTRRQAITDINGFDEQVDRYEVFSVNSGLREAAYHGNTDIGDELLFLGASVDAVVGDAQYELLFELRTAVGQDADPISGGSGPHFRYTEIWVRQSQPDAQIGRNAGVVAIYVLPGRARASAIQVDSEGNLYVLDTAESRVHKFTPTIRKPDGSWQSGKHVGWLGRCSSNRVVNGVPFNACDEARGISMGYACTDYKCLRDAGDAGAEVAGRERVWDWILLPS